MEKPRITAFRRGFVKDNNSKGLWITPYETARMIPHPTSLGGNKSFFPKQSILPPYAFTRPPQ